MAFRFFCAAVVAACLLAAATVSAEWGALRGRFVVEGEPPLPAAITPQNDPFCENAKPVDQRVLVGDNGGLKNAVIYLRAKRGETVPIHPNYAAALTESVTLANRGCCFAPRITLLRTGQKLVVTNADPTAHNTKFDLVKNDPLNSVIAAEEELTTTFSKAETLPLPVSCNIHPFMRGYLLVRDDPYMTVTDADGSFAIENLPAGEHQFQFWHETGYLKDVGFDGGVA
ncbi:MAG: hypothetical protein AAF589_01670, partial [Planctomycetota bacterium]